jgi:hypothetical protein
MNLFDLFRLIGLGFSRRAAVQQAGTRPRRQHATMGKSHFAKVKARNRRRSQIARLSRRVNRQRVA